MLLDAIQRGWLWVSKHLVWLLLSLVAVAVIVLLSIYADEFPEWTGLRTFDPGGNRLIRAKTLWDWLDLLIVGAVLAAGGILLNRSARRRELERAESQREQELRIAEDNRNQATLQAYYDKMADLILNHSLKDEDEGKDSRSIARARTLATLRGLDEERKGSLLRFLYETALIETGSPVVRLREANLRNADLFGANLHGADLSWANLHGANMGRAELSWTNLEHAVLREANLSRAILVDASLIWSKLIGADLGKATLVNANMRGAKLVGANLHEADLNRAELSFAVLSEADMSGAKLSDAKYNKETKWPDGFDPEAAGAIPQESE